MIGRIPILDVSPVLDHGTAKAATGETIPVSATVIREGHDALGAGVVLYDPRGRRRPLRTMSLLAPGTDRYGTEVTVDHEGRWSFVVEAWSDPMATWRHDAGIKIPLGQDVDLMLEEGARLFERAARRVPRRPAMARIAAALRDDSLSPAARLEIATGPEVAAELAADPLRELVTRTKRFPLVVHRRRALYGSWYEFFPRSEGAAQEGPDGTWRSGTLATAAKRLPAIADMGFDVVYLPPIHPVGRSFRKGPNNTLEAGPGDPGSVWAIGAAEGGHDTVHPDLGTLADFDDFVAAAGENGLEVALDLALQCSPDHPWVVEHPEWFTRRADGSIAYAENPPKKYQDIYPLNFDNDPEGIYAEVLRVVRHWMDHGVRIFRVDNPHTKPVAFWERLLADIAATDPDVLFLSEAFTRPAMMRTLAKVGFHQSYTYFTWRNTKEEIEDYLRELTQETAHFLRPNLFANTPDILSGYLQHGGRPAFEIRAVLAATLSPAWGIYSGYELCENTPVRPGSEEYLDSEKYQYRPRDWAAAESEEKTITPLLRRLNWLRRNHPALQELRNLRFHHVDQPELICFSKRLAGAGDQGRDDVVLVVVNLDPHHAHEATVWLDMPALGFPPDSGITVTDQISGESYHWGAANYVRLDPHIQSAHIFTAVPAE
ncbi:alpha-1,4-glucan--maltose-1-phosphate maltosyltransferase [Streptomonospora nanhaiensis]|uniref:Alpha-1,4-glucan:maltose-1-phosphate maltosyltransferase n=1 Tax=Streptomonospora nanhaiensis TaxID=1323731 RepID=A0A853BLC1_9ACTN|nr:alpha-1,4-glucan--maltose-1-phosphate maltosyltransferase [Streptomonospora nanhaiensis]MBV2365902.1 alpha-1,4-glucan--maltose-1-phosphate maltosyltransferase [Streptomonospora nanhaiensis]MBX9389011.1 alpha-1,4-glucan--maltose-1-phosphate maltosyltransferase [Streptomonospora nanhaiensis]NYI95790.1 starch synthase (maltosyl-transferring) [Streptomonospora nanhaiensis]